ncbi:hypothetical protein ACFY93_00990 [Streptomyces sp. NPDC008313]|uniref:hypothetical protein n=1 Tax=Streptomyces sp. NPDC008313 TaxID=3364826 RepID=UPI0036EC4C83
MSTARRSLLTATAAGALLGALWFVPSANATQDVPVQHTSNSTGTRTSLTAQTYRTGAVDGTSTGDLTESAGPADSGDTTGSAADVTDATGDGPRLADTGSVDTTPYVIGGTLFLGLGAGFVAYSVRRERTTAC